MLYEVITVSEQAKGHAEERVLDQLLPSPDYHEDDEERRKAQERWERSYNFV